MNPIALGFLINSALYLLMVFGAALADDNTWAITLTTATAGVNTLSYFMQHFDSKKPAIVCCMLSWALGVAAGGALLIGYLR